LFFEENHDIVYYVIPILSIICSTTYIHENIAIVPRSVHQSVKHLFA